MSLALIHYSQVEFNPAFEAGCAGKEKRESELAAQAVLDFRVKVKTARSGDGMHPYLCGFCGKWHLGHGVASGRLQAPAHANKSRNA